MSNKIKENLLLLFERPREPVFMPKGANSSVFTVPEDYLTDRFQPLQGELTDRFANETKTYIEVKPIKIPNLSVPLSLGRQENFSLFLPFHRQMAAVLIDTFMAQPTLEDFQSLAVYARDRINPIMYIYALSVAILHRRDTRNMRLPTLVEVFPEKFMDSAIFSQARQESNVINKQESRRPLVIPRDYTASDLEEEHKLAYFREDLGINLHHWHWHLVYPFEASEEIVNKDRRGELFYYMHQQIMARYNFERLCNNLGRTKRLTNFNEPIPEGYFPKLDSLVSSRVWPGRNSGTILSDINREVDQIKFDIQDMQRWRDRFFMAIHSGNVITKDNKTKQLDEATGIDTLGNMMESSILSVNRFVYGDLHNFGHVAIALAHDPDARYLETFGVMGDPATAMRDPIFYRWHATVDDIFQEHKNVLNRYQVEQLGFTGVRVTSAEIVTLDKNSKNILKTGWQQSNVDMSRGLDFTPRGNVYAQFTHLQHVPFGYRIEVQNSGQMKIGTCRIFMAPKFDERGLPFLFKDQKNLFIELDKFAVNLPSGKTTINRDSKISTVTIPFEQTFRNLENNRPTGGATLEGFNFCGCGWPQHMLVPRGTAAGFKCELFVMISDYQDDRVEQVSGSQGQGQCKVNASSYCGLRDAKYPDKRSMGYPFDRQPRNGVNRLTEFLTPNMIVTDVTIMFSDGKLNNPSANQG